MSTSKVDLIIPTRNEEGNIPPLMKALEPYGYHVVIVDDSDDNTAELAEKLGATVIHGRRKGLAQAVLDGIDQTYGEYIIVMDADLQHPHDKLPEFVHQLDYHDLVIGTKHTKEAMADMTAWRKLQSNLAVWLTHFIVPAPVSDPMTGFFGIRRSCLEGIPRKELSEDGVGIEAIGFKIGLELFVKAKWVSHAEVPIVFGQREFGVSKGTRHSLQTHLWHLFNDTLNYEIQLPDGSQEYHAFYEANAWQRDWKQSIAFLLQQITEDIVPVDLLDIGCGSSPNINYMWAAHKTGMDIREEAIKYLKTHSNSSGATFTVGSVLDIPRRDCSYDCVTCIEVIEHLHEPEVNKALSEISRVLRVGGYAIIATPNYRSVLWNVIENLQKYLQPGEWTSDHYTKFHRNKLATMCENHGLKEVRYDTVMAGMDMIMTLRKEGA